MQARKLKQLTLATLAAKHSQLGYDLLRAELDVDSLRELEDLVLDTVYQGLIDAKIDQAQKKIIVDWAIGRDVRDRCRFACVWFFAHTFGQRSGHHPDRAEHVSLALPVFVPG